MTARLVEAVARGPRHHVQGLYQRHASARHTGLAGSTGGRWGPGGFPVLYLGRPTDAVVAEAYRWLVDPTEGLTGSQVRNRVLLTVRVDVVDVLDLRDSTSLEPLGLTTEDLGSPINSGEAYGRCRAVAQAAHQLQLNGIVAPAASGLGVTLALFTRHLGTTSQLPEVVAEERWEHLPADPRRLRLVERAAGEP